MSVLKKTFSAAGPVMRLLLGAGALLMVVTGIKNRPVKNSKDGDSRGTRRGE